MTVFIEERAGVPPARIAGRPESVTGNVTSFLGDIESNCDLDSPIHVRESKINHEKHQ